MQAEYITSKDVSFCHASNRREHQQLQPQYVHVYANVTEFVDCLTQHVVCDNIFHESLIKLMVLHMLKDRAAVLIHPRILQRLYPIRCGGPEARTPPLKLENVSCRQQLQTDHPRMHLHPCGSRRIDSGEYYPVLRGRLSAGTKPKHWCWRGIVAGHQWFHSYPTIDTAQSHVGKHSSSHRRGPLRDIGKCMLI
jgi:hypothetical protein